MKRAFATLEDVARAVQMSRAQVSRALRGDPGVRAETRSLIQAKARELDYRPNLAARSLAEARSPIVGLIIGELANPFHIQQAHAVDDCLRRHGHEPVVSLRAVDESSVQEEAERLLRLRASGVILLGTPRTPRAIIELAQHLPAVYLGSKQAAHPQLATITTDDAGGVRQALSQLYALGHRRIAHIAGGSEPSAADRTAAYLEFMQQAGLPTHIAHGSHDASSGWQGVGELFASRHAPTAIFTSNDMIAMGALDRLKCMGIDVPGDVSVIGFDDIPDAATEVVSLSSIRQDIQYQADHAVQLLNRLIAGTPPAQPCQITPVQLILRRSVAAPATTD